MKSDKLDLLEKREYLVVKHNDLVQKSRYELSIQEQKTIAFICSKIKPASDSNYILDYDFSIKEYCQVCGIDYKNGANYKYIKETLKALRDKSFWVTLADGSETVVAWLDRVTTNKKSGTVKIKIDDRLAPYMFNLQKQFTQYQLYNILAMKSAFSVRLYELLKSYAYQSPHRFEIDELKKMLMVSDVKSYKDYSLFRKKVLEVAEKEINELTDLNIFYETETKGRKVVSLLFHIKKKDTYCRLKTAYKVNRELKGVRE